MGPSWSFSPPILGLCPPRHLCRQPWTEEVVTHAPESPTPLSEGLGVGWGGHRKETVSCFIVRPPQARERSPCCGLAFFQLKEPGNGQVGPCGRNF